VICRDLVNGHEADIVTVTRVFCAGISKANDKFHGATLAYAAVQRQPGGLHAECAGK
jgi:hypothetical protein